MPVLSASDCMASCRSEQEESMKNKKVKKEDPSKSPLKGETFLPPFKGGLGWVLFFHLFNFLSYNLSFDGSYSGEHFAFDGFEQSAAASGDVAHLVFEAELVDASHGVATANE